MQQPLTYSPRLRGCLCSAKAGVFPLLLLPLAAQAQEHITVSPATVHLESARDYRQLVVTGYFNGVPHDLTAQATLTSGNPKVTKASGTRLWAAGDGQTQATVRVAGKTIPVPVTVRGAAKADPVRFAFETVPVLTKQGCASGSCHGSPHGKGGFSLSLFGYEPKIDQIALTRDGFNRRVNVLEPAESLILKKPTLAIPHVGGKRLKKTDTGYGLLNRWVYEGAQVTLPQGHVTGITITPAEGRVLQAPYKNQQLSVVAQFSDGTSRDVTAIATYETSHPSVAEVDMDGHVAGKGRGQAAISVRYLDKLVSVPITVVEPVKNFVWKPVPENNKIDTLVNAKLKQLQYLPSGTCSDSEFVRRVHLDLTGLLPTAEATRAFLADKSPEKRGRLIDRLVDSDDFAHFWALKKADLMRISPRRLPNGQAERFARWLVEATRQNLPYDQLARTILTATGSTDVLPAAGYFLAIPTPEERTELTAQVFLGSRVECAKCHNHPFEAWTMRDYYKIAAVFARTQAKGSTVTLASSGEVNHPTSGEIMAPWSPTKSPSDDRRAAFAQWLTAPGNPLFARVEANRLWAELTGRGIVEPVDDFRSSNPPSNAPLLDYLAQELERSGFDRKRLVKLICKSQTYQRTTNTNPFNASDDVLFSHAKVRLLTAEQLKDALGITAGALEPTTALAPQLATLQARLTARTQALEAAYPAWLQDKTEKAKSLALWQGGWHQAGPFLKDQAALEKNGLPINAALRLDLQEGSESRFDEGQGAYYLGRRLHADTERTVSATLRTGAAATVWLNGTRVGRPNQRGDIRLTLTLPAGDSRLLVRLNGDNPNFSWKLDAAEAEVPGYVLEALTTDPTLVHAHYLAADPERAELLRQSRRLEDRDAYATQRLYPELSPFLSTFGQPARETACTCERRQSPTLLQALELLNGRTAYQTVSEGVSRYADLDDAMLVETLYLSAFSRLPSEKEKAVAGAFLTRTTDRRAAVTDLVWTIVSTQEFLFRK